MLYCYNSCAILKPIHYHLVSDCDKGLHILHTHTHTSATWKTQAWHFCLSQKEEQKYSEFVVLVHKMLLVLIGRLPLLAQTHQKITYNKIGTSQRQVYRSSTPNPPTIKIAVKPGANMKCKMWWCSNLHEVQIFITTSMRENEQESMMHVFTLQSPCNNLTLTKLSAMW
jgi:hypothetical protein